MAVAHMVFAVEVCIAVGVAVVSGPAAVAVGAVFDPVFVVSGPRRPAILVVWDDLAQYVQLYLSHAGPLLAKV